MKRKGFTLIELLAVIVILAIIALIATPIVMNVIENTRKGAAERSVDNYLRAVETAIATARLDDKIVADGTYTIAELENIVGEIEVSGNKPSDGTIKIENGTVVAAPTTTIKIGEYTVSYDSDGNLVATKNNEETEVQTQTVSGNYITVNNVSDVEHSLKVNLSSDIVTDFSSVNVSRYGSNLLDISELLKDTLLVDNGDGTYTYTRTEADSSSVYSNYQDIFIPQGTPVYMSVNVIDNNLTQGILYASYLFEDGTKELLAITGNNVSNHTFDKNVVGIAVMCSSNVNEVGDYMIFSEPQLNIGEKQDYQDYITVQTVTANADGSVNGLASTYPNLTIITNNKDVVISCKYQKKN